MRRLLVRWTAERVLWLVLAAVVIGVAIVPLLRAVDAAFYGETGVGLSTERSLQAVQDVYFTSEYLRYLANTLILAATVTMLSLVFGVGMAFLVARTDIPYRSLFDFLIIMPLFMSPFTGMMAWIALASEKSGFLNGIFAWIMTLSGLAPNPIVNIWSYAGIVWVMFLFFCPFAYLFTSGNLRAMDASLEEAARTTGATPLQTLLRVTLPMSVPAILASGLLIFVLSAEIYTIPGMIGAPIGFTNLPWKIYRNSTTFPLELAHAAAAGTLLLWVTVIGIWLQRRITRQAERFVTVTGKGFRVRPLPLGRWKIAALMVVGFYILSADVLPFTGLILSSFMKFSAPAINADVFTVRHFVEFFTLQNTFRAFGNTLLLAVLSATACVLIGLLISYMEVRRPGRWTRALAFLGVLPVAVPGIIYGVGLLWTFLRTPVYGTIWVLLLAYIAKFLPYGIAVSRSGVLQIHPELEQSARISGANGLTALRAITMPLLKPTLIAILVFVMLMSIKELSASVMLYTQRSQVLSVLTWHYMDAGLYQFAAAIGVIQTFLMIGLIFLTRALFRVKLEKTFAKS